MRFTACYYFQKNDNAFYDELIFIAKILFDCGVLQRGFCGSCMVMDLIVK